MKTIFYIFMLAFTVFFPMNAKAQNVSDHFTRVSGPETFFSSAVTRGYTTNSSYYGYVEVLVSGTWHNDACSVLDAWYQFQFCGTTYPPNHDGYAMTIGLSGCSWVQECGADNIRDWTVFHDGIGFMQPGVSPIPPYNPSHEYHFVINVTKAPVNPMNFTFGVGDGGSYDNSGGLQITLYQLQLGGPTSTQSSTWGRLKSLYR